MLSLIPAYAQYITGKVIADDDGLPLIGATVWFAENPSAKVRVGETGTYRIRYRQGTLVFHCFGFNDEKVNVRKPQSINIRLKPESAMMTEVVVEAKKKKYTRKGNPAVEMMQKVIAAKKACDMRNNDFVTFNKYARTMIALNDFNPEKLEQDEALSNKKFLADYAETCPETGKTIVPISIEEKSTTELYRKSDDKNKSIVHGHHAESLLDVLSAGEFLESKFKDNLKDIDIYKDEIVVLQHNFISPIGGNAAIKFYHYSIVDSVYEDGDKCYKIAFSPANVQDAGFSGHLYIMADSTWRVKRAKFGVPVASNINFVRQMDVDQQYISLPGGEQICSKNRMMMQLKLTSYLKEIFVDHNVSYSNWSFDPIPDNEIEFLGEERYEKGAKNRSKDFWVESRPDTLSQAQAGVAEMKRKFVDRPVVKAVIYGMRVILDNYLETSTNPNKPSKVVIGPFFSSVGHSWVEGFRIRMGAMTTGAFNPHWFLSGWAKYGFKDKRPKGEFSVAYSFNEKEKDIIAYPIRMLKVSYTNDIQSPADKFQEFDKDNAFMSISWNVTHFQSYYERFCLLYDWEFNNGLRIGATVKHERNRGAGDLYFNTIKNWDQFSGQYHNDNNGNLSYTPGAHDKLLPGQMASDLYKSNTIRYTELQLAATYQPGVKYINTKTQRFLSNREAPIYGFQHTVGLLHDPAAQGVTAYNYSEFTFKKRFWLKSWGSIDAYHNASFQWNHVPFQLLCLPRANLSYIRSDNTFSLIRNFEFLNDRTFTMMYRWDLNGKIFNRIPLIKKLKWREAIGFNLMWGYLTRKNNPYRFDPNSPYFDFYNEAGNPQSGINYDKMRADDSYDYLYRFPGYWQTNTATGQQEYISTTQIMNRWTPYVEITAGIHNIFKFFSVDYVHRLTYTDAPNVQTWGVRFAFEATF